MPRFASVTEEEAREIEAGKNAVRTKKATEVMTNVLKESIKEKKIAINLETASQQTVNQLLEMFYFEVRKKDGKLYKKIVILCLKVWSSTIRVG